MLAAQNVPEIDQPSERLAYNVRRLLFQLPDKSEIPLEHNTRPLREVLGGARELRLVDKRGEE